MRTTQITVHTEGGKNTKPQNRQIRYTTAGPSLLLDSTEHSLDICNG